MCHASAISLVSFLFTGLSNRSRYSEIGLEFEFVHVDDQMFGRNAGHGMNALSCGIQVLYEDRVKLPERAVRSSLG